MLKFLSLIFLFFFVACSTPMPEDLGMLEGKLLVCPNSPNCVSSMAAESDEEHYIEPVPFEDIQEARLKTLTVLMKNSKTNIITQDKNYIHAEYTTPIFRFVDDIEFYFDEENKLLHFRSASRLGYSDLGANRRRMEDFKKKYLKETP